MNTADYRNALRGLHVRRLCMRATFPFRQLSRALAVLLVFVRGAVWRAMGRKVALRSQSFVWTVQDGKNDIRERR